MSQKFKVAAIQLRTELEQSETMDKAERLISEAAASGADFICLPEMFNCPYSGRYFHQFAHEDHRPTVERMAGWARTNHIYLVGGSICENEDGKMYNTCYVFDREGSIIAKHRKIHMFDVNVPSRNLYVMESNNFTPGNQITLFDTEYGTMGVAICFDLRFSELFRTMQQRGANVFFVPAQFSSFTGPTHWDKYLCIRASDTQSFFIGCCAAKYEGFSYESYGHSEIISPEGIVLESCDEREQILYGEIDLELLEQKRAEIPVINNLRRDVYSVPD